MGSAIDAENPVSLLLYSIIFSYIDIKEFYVFLCGEYDREWAGDYKNYCEMQWKLHGGNKRITIISPFVDYFIFLWQIKVIKQSNQYTTN